MSATTLVTGAGGHIGGHVVRALLAKGRRVRVMLLPGERARALDGLEVERVDGDVRRPETLARACAGVEVVFHLAAIISIQGDRGGLVTETNVGGVRNTAAAARGAGVRRFVHFSSVHAFDMSGQTLTERSARAGPSDSAYNRSKWGGEQALREEIGRGLDAVIVNPGGIIGPLDLVPSRMGRFFLDLRGRRFPSLVAGGFSWVDARDVASSALAAEEKGRTGENYILGGHWATLPELAALAASVTGVAPPRVVAPQWLARVGAPFMDAWGAVTKREPLYTTESLHALRGTRTWDMQKARDELGHAPRPLAESVRDIYASFDEAGVR